MLGQSVACLDELATRLAWSAVAFGVWDVAYYGWLWCFWLAAVAADVDLLFLIPVRARTGLGAVRSAWP